MNTFETRNFDLDNGRGDTLSARLEYPTEHPPVGFAIFANCFTCEKEFFAPKRITRALAEQSIAAVRFDFTGLGESGGDFSQTNFTTNLQDMRAVAEKIKAEFGLYPELLLGHSFGGAAAIGLAAILGNDTIKTVATIGAPKDPRHVMRHFEEHQQILKRDGMIEITVANRTYTLRQQFADDVKSHDIESKTRAFTGGLFVFHDPKDDMVKFENAVEIFDRGGGPSYLIRMDGAGHMLSNTKATSYVADTLTDWIVKQQAPVGVHVETKNKSSGSTAKPQL